VGQVIERLALSLARRRKSGLITVRHIKIYPGARRSFFNDRQPSYNAGAAQDSWQRVLAFFKEHV